MSTHPNKDAKNMIIKPSFTKKLQWSLRVLSLFKNQTKFIILTTLRIQISIENQLTFPAS